MKTLNLEQAAKILHMSPSTLRAKAKSGQVRASKPGRCWVFTKAALREFLDVQADLVLANASKQVVLPCQSISVEEHGGFGLQHRPDNEYANRLGLGTKRPPKNSMTH